MGGAIGDWVTIVFRRTDPKEKMIGVRMPLAEEDGREARKHAPPQKRHIGRASSLVTFSHSVRFAHSREGGEKSSASVGKRGKEREKKEKQIPLPIGRSNLLRGAFLPAGGRNE